MRRMVVHRAALLLVLALPIGRARADTAPPTGAPPPSEGLRLRGVPAHEAALFAGELHQLNVLVIGGSDRPISADLPADAEAAMAGIASRAKLAPSRCAGGRVTVLAPVEPRPAPTRLGLAGERRVSLSFLRARADDVARLLCEVVRCRVPEHARPAGELSILARNVSAGDLLELLASLAGGAIRRGGEVAFVEGAALPPILARAPGGDALAPPVSDPPRPLPCPESHALTPTRVLLGCLDGRDLALEAIGGPIDRRLALLRRSNPPSRGWIVRVGDRVGTQQWRVARIDADAVVLERELEDRLTLPLPPP